jgi:hypothetical protein
MKNRFDDDESIEALLVRVREQFGARGHFDISDCLTRPEARAEPEIARATLAEVLRYEGTIHAPGGFYWDRVKKAVAAHKERAEARAEQETLNFTPAPVRIDAATTALVLAQRGGDEASIAAMPPATHAHIARQHAMYETVTRWHALSPDGSRPTVGHLLGALDCCRAYPRAEAFFTAAFAGKTEVDGRPATNARLLYNARFMRAGRDVLAGKLSKLTEDRYQTTRACHAHFTGRNLTRLTGAVNGKPPTPYSGP